MQRKTSPSRDFCFYLMVSKVIGTKNVAYSVADPSPGAGKAAGVRAGLGLETFAFI